MKSKLFKKCIMLFIVSYRKGNSSNSRHIKGFRRSLDYQKKSLSVIGDSSKEEKNVESSFCESIKSLSPGKNSDCWESHEYGGCNHLACQKAVCSCDSYCCLGIWDLSCAGYYFNSESIVKDNYF